MARLVALIAQADGGDYDALSPPHALYSQCCHIQPAEPCEPKPQDFLLRIVQQHKEIKVREVGRGINYNLARHTNAIDTYVRVTIGKLFSFSNLFCNDWSEMMN